MWPFKWKLLSSTFLWCWFVLNLLFFSLWPPRSGVEGLKNSWYYVNVTNLYRCCIHNEIHETLYPCPKRILCSYFRLSQTSENFYKLRNIVLALENLVKHPQVSQCNQIHSPPYIPRRPCGIPVLSTLRGGVVLSTGSPCSWGIFQGSWVGLLLHSSRWCVLCIHLQKGIKRKGDVYSFLSSKTLFLINYFFNESLVYSCDALVISGFWSKRERLQWHTFFLFFFQSIWSAGKWHLKRPGSPGDEDVI